MLLELYFWEQWTGAELGRFLAVPEDTARSRLRKAKKQLEAAIEALRASPELIASTLSNLDAWVDGLRPRLVAFS